MRRAAINGLFGLALVMMMMAPASAHAFLKSADPAVGSTVHGAPKMLVLSFTEDLEVAFCSVAVSDGMGMNDTAGKPQPVPGHPNELMVPLNIQMPGEITVTWHALSVDTHKTQGHFSFTVTP